MATGLLPFGENCEDVNEIYEEVLTQEVDIPNYLDEDVKDLINLLLKKNPNERLSSFDALKNHKFFNKFSFVNIFRILKLKI